MRSPFPPVESALPNGLLCIYDDLSAEALIAAYSGGIFPWSSDKYEVQWWSPDPRCVIFPEHFHCSKSLRRAISRQGFSFSIDRQLDEVIRACATIERRDEDGTWIHSRLVDGYRDLSRYGLMHSVEVYQEGNLCGGLYGISIGSQFAGESMFSRVPNASKAALAVLVEFCLQNDIKLIDCQIPTPHLLSLGAEEVERAQFMQILRVALAHESIRAPWSRLGRD